MKDLRIASGLTQEQLARKVDVSLSTVRNWDRGSTFPEMSPAAMAKLISALNTDLATLAEAEQTWRSSR